MERRSVDGDTDNVFTSRSSSGGGVALRHGATSSSVLRHAAPPSLRHCADETRRRRRESWAASVLAGRSTPPPTRATPGEGSNLLVMKYLGHSEPILSSPMGMSSVSGTSTVDRSLCDPVVGSPLFARRNKLIRQVSHSDARRQRPLSLPLGSVQMKKDCVSAVRKVACSRSSLHRRSMIGMTSPVMLRSQSPFAASPMDSPKIVPVAQHHFSSLAARRSMEARRWSLASLPSSGYGTTPGSSNVSSQCSSHERLHQLQFSGAAAPPSPAAVSATASVSVGSPFSADLLPPLAAPAHIDSRLLRHYSSNESNQSADEDVTTAGGLTAVTSCVTGRVSPLVRPRSRSLSSPIRFPLADDEIVMMNTMYKERFPTATRQMEERLQTMIDEYEQRDSDVEAVSPSAVAVVRFVKHQVMEMVRDCLNKSQEKLITSTYFYELSENLETLISETCEKSAEAGAVVAKLARRFLLTVARPARLLECLQFDPDQFYQMLTHAEGEAVQCEGVGVADVPQYVLNKLGLQRDPLSDLTRDLHQLESGEVTPVSSTPKSTDLPSLSSSKVPCESDYEVIKLISNGAYGAVYLVRHRESRLRYAMKRINKQNMVLRNQAEQVFAERDIMSFTDNPFVVSFYCSFETKKHLCLVMEYVEGGDCAALLKVVGVLPVDMARLYFAETVLAVEYLHNFGVVHRDLKPDNLLITAMGHVKLTDFGLSKMGLMSLATNLYEGYIDRETKQFSDKQVFGTPEYIAPEVILRRGYGKPVDWWAMGVILYEFLVGRVPFFGETPEELFSHTVNDDIEWPDESDVIPEARDLITQLLAQDPLQRLGTESAQEVKIHPFFEDIDWDNLLRQKVEFIPQLENDEDTSYFDTRADRYFHDLEEDTDDTEDSLVFSSFSSCSPRFKKVQTKLELKKCSSHGDSSLSDHSDHSSVSVCGVLDSTANISAKSHALLSNSVMSDPGSVPVFLTTPESSQTESEDVSPLMRRRRRPLRDVAPPLPRLSVSIDDGPSGEHVRELSPVEESDKSPPRSTAPPTTTIISSSSSSCSSSSPSPSPLLTTTAAASVSVAMTSSADTAATSAPSGVRTPTLTVTVPCVRSPLLTAASRQRSRGLSQRLPPQHQGVAKSASSSSVLNLVIPVVGELASGDSLQSPGGSSTASSRDGSPCRELSPLLSSLRAPITVRRGPRGFGFTVRAIRVYLGSSDFYTVHHLVMNVDGGGAAFESGLQPGDLITHVNGQSVQGLLHTQLMRLMMSGGHTVTLRTAPLEHTTISSGNRPPRIGRLAKRCPIQRRHIRREVPGAVAASGAAAAVLVTPPAVLAGSAPAGAVGGVDRRRKTPSLLRKLSSRRANAELQQHHHHQHVHQRLTRMAGVQADTAETVPAMGGSPGAVSQRPVSLHGLKHMMHTTSPPVAVAAASTAASGAVNRRKSVGHIPLSPLARTPSPGPSPVPATRSPSPRPCPVQPLTAAVRADPVPVRPSPLACSPLPRVTVTAHPLQSHSSASPLLPIPAIPLQSQLVTGPAEQRTGSSSSISSTLPDDKNSDQSPQQDSVADLRGAPLTGQQNVQQEDSASQP